MNSSVNGGNDHGQKREFVRLGSPLSSNGTFRRLFSSFKGIPNIFNHPEVIVFNLIAPSEERYRLL